MSTITSSPRLPSPPPPTEIQIGAKSPSLSGAPASQESLMEQSIIEANATRRIHPGTKAADMAAGPPLIALSDLDSAFQLQEHLKALHYYYSKPSSDTHTIPINRETARLISSQPEGVDRALWLYELCRFLINKCNDLIIGFLFDDPPCSATTCPEMRASEWQFLCAVHESPKSCCAIDYCCHTLDWATNIVTSQKIFPSRLSLGAGDAIDDRGAGVKHLVNIFRRLHRIFAHAWFQHRGVFWNVEGQTGLYVLFKTVCDGYELLPAENYKLPPEAEGLETIEEQKPPVPSIFKGEAPTGNAMTPIEEDFVNVGRTHTRRHIRQSPSVGSAVPTVLESDEEDHPRTVTRKLSELRVTEEEEEQDEGTTEVPVIVETYEVDENADSTEDDNQEQVVSTSELEHKESNTETEVQSLGDSKDESTVEEPVEDGLSSKPVADATEATLAKDNVDEEVTNQAKAVREEEKDDGTETSDEETEKPEGKPEGETVQAEISETAPEPNDDPEVEDKPEPELKKAGVTKPEAKQSEAKQSDIKEPETKKPETEELDTKGPEIEEPEIEKPEVEEPEITESEITEPEIQEKDERDDKEKDES
ncbi:MOB kinase activator-like 4 [Phlyctema vagabunda]|uniref:MOB kinase activator-like 4 n=1 Tax=Phlyctema vagabunda TaxID=108571 RepID=A0ABR4PYD5_9HELO